MTRKLPSGLHARAQAHTSTLPRQPSHQPKPKVTLQVSSKAPNKQQNPESPGSFPLSHLPLLLEAQQETESTIPWKHGEPGLHRAGMDMGCTHFTCAPTGQTSKNKGEVEAEPEGCSLLPHRTAPPILVSPCQLSSCSINTSETERSLCAYLLPESISPKKPQQENNSPDVATHNRVEPRMGTTGRGEVTTGKTALFPYGSIY